MEVRLIVRTGPLKNKEIALHTGETLVGRRKGCNIRLGDARVSRQHCKILFDGRQVFIEDMDSANGTFVNGKRVQRAALKAGDVIQVGGVQFGLAGAGEVSDAEVAMLPRPRGAPVASEEESVAGVMAAMAEAESEPAAQAEVLPIELDFGTEEPKAGPEKHTEVLRPPPGKKKEEEGDELVLEEPDQAQSDAGILNVRWEPPKDQEKPKK